MLRVAVLVLFVAALAEANIKFVSNKDPYDNQLVKVTDGGNDVFDVCGDKLFDGTPFDIYALRAKDGLVQDFLNLHSGEFEHRDDQRGFVLRFRMKGDKTIQAKVFFVESKKMLDLEYSLESDKWTKMVMRDVNEMPEDPCMPTHKRGSRGFAETCTKVLDSIGFTCKFINSRTKSILYKVVCAVVSFGAGLFTPVPGDGLALTAACHTAINTAVNTCKVASPASKLGSQVCKKMSGST